jgi:hypothetical protein
MRRGSVDFVGASDRGIAALKAGYGAAIHPVNSQNTESLHKREAFI